jgi:hypothetical protein
MQNKSFHGKNIMKILILITAVFALFLTGCSSTYKVSDFSSKDKFYEVYNKFAKDRNVEVNLINDSTFTASEGTKILNDTLIVVILVPKKEKLSKDEIRDIKYSGINMPNLSAVITLKNGKIVKSENVSVLSDSILNVIVIESSYQYFTINKIKNIIYKNHWLGLPVPLIFGTITGAVVGLPVGAVLSEQDISNSNRPQAGTNSQNQAGEYSILGLSAIGLVTGGILGWVHGYTYIYQFNP